MNTYKDGYNATLGGDGKSWRDYKSIAEKYQELQNESAVALFFGCDRKTVRNACKEYGIPIISTGEHAKNRIGKPVDMLDKNGKILKHFTDMSEAGRYLLECKIAKGKIKNVSTAIGRVASGKRKTAYNFYWRYSE